MESEMKKCVIIGSAPCEYGGVLDEIDIEDSYIICADGGLDIALEHHLVPNLLIGDFDSVKSELPGNIETIRLHREKDDTDMSLSMRAFITSFTECRRTQGIKSVKQLSALSMKAVPL